MNNSSFSTKRIAMGYAKRPWLHKNVILELQSEIGNFYSNGLDVGCGAGLSTKALHLICQNVTGTDISKDMIDVCRELYNEDSMSFYVAKAEETKIPIEKYDIVTAAGVVNWVDRLAFLNNMKDVMTDDGRLIIYDFWITNSMLQSKEYTRWYDELYLMKFPKPPRNENVWTQIDMNGLMTIKQQRDFEVTYPFNKRDFIDFMMIQSNVNEKIQKHEISEDEAYSWMDDTLSSIFQDDVCDIVFHGYYWIMVK